MIGIYVFALAVAILLSAVFTVSELAIFTPAESRIRALVEEGVRGSGALAQLRARPERILVLLRLCDTLADLTAGALVAVAVYARWETLALALALGAVALIVVYAGELLPIGLAANYGLRLALGVAPLFLVWTRVLAVPLDGLSRLARVRPRRVESLASASTEAEMRQLISLGHSEGVVGEHERELIERATRVDDIKVWDIMTPRVECAGAAR